MKKSIWFPLMVFCVMAMSACQSSATEGPVEVTVELTTEAPIAGIPANTQRLRNVDGMVMVYVPAAKFEMGSDEEEVELVSETCSEYRSGCQWNWFTDEQPIHTVELDVFWMDQTEVTNAQYQACVDAGICDVPGCLSQDDFNSPDHPVVCVTWDQTQDYCSWVEGRLPTEAEWEYAARGPQGSRYPWGDEFDGTLLNYCDANCEQRWADDSFDDGYTFTAPVGSYPEGASWCGVLDMAGNVWEWVEDLHGDYPVGEQVNPTGAAMGSRRVARGGAWLYDRSRNRGAERSYDSLGFMSNYHGFRCITTISEPGG